MVKLIRRHLVKLFAVGVGVAVIDHGEVDAGISCRGRTRQRILEDEAFFFGKTHILDDLEVDGRAWLDFRRILLRVNPRKAGIKRCLLRMLLFSFRYTSILPRRVVLAITSVFPSFLKAWSTSGAPGL